MKLTRIHIRNFRCLRDVELCVDPTTVLIGENNVGKTSILEAVRIALSRRWGQRGGGFGEKDFFTKEPATESRPDEAISVELEFAESEAREWSEKTLANMTGYLRYDAQANLNSVCLRVKCQFDSTAGDIQTTFRFIGQDEKEVIRRVGRSANTSRFFDHVPVFSLNALRDSQQEFQPRAHFWRSLLRSVKVPEDEWSSISAEIEQLNKRVLDADPKMKSITDKLSEIRNIVSKASAESLDLRAMPLNEWDLVSRAEVILRSSNTAPWLPLANHGQGVQSLAVIYLFQAFVDHLIGASDKSDITPVLLLEEPEAHLHPQAARGLGREVMGIAGTKIIASHSSHFVEKIPIRALRVLRQSASGTVIRHLRDEFHAELPANDALLDFVREHPDYSFDTTKGYLVVRGRVEKNDLARLRGFFGGKSIDEKNLEALERLYRESQDYFSDDEIRAFEDPVRRIRGEIFFSRIWVLCEGMTEYLLLHAFLTLFDYPLDVNGVSVIDFKNSGKSASTFAVLARALGFPWIMTCDGDQAGDGFISSLKNRGFTDEDIDRNVIRNPHRNLEESLIHSHLRSSLVEIAGELNLSIDASVSDEDLAESMKRNKSEFATRIAERAYQKTIEKHSLPEFFTDIYEAIRRKNQGTLDADE
ncbi:ATP-dependent nuclease [Thioalkalivibrio sp. HK1]|uniref:ATP-dependent nuclease n=1 Tax=Thioalkalivibrio sp. HK1 TaxID=1469245 RepID=UPI000472507A|nr:AAA family ATPase [Thioalkalivibrio sp. HK1]